MNVLFVSKDLAALPLACTLVEEGNVVKVFEREKCWNNKIRRPGIRFVCDWRNELEWVGKDGLIVFDDTGMGKTQDDLRTMGFSVFGGCELGEKLENNRQQGQKIFSTVGIKMKESVDFYDIDKMISFIKKNRKKWVIKQNGHMDKGLNYVGQLDSGEDAISVLKNYKKTLKKDCGYHFDLQEKIDGIEIAVGRFFNGNNWVGPLCINIEHKNLFDNDLGPKTHEMGNLMWYEKNESNRLFQETLAKMEDYLRNIGFKGYFDINCIADKDNAWPLEATARLGHPTTQIQDSLHESKWGEFLKSIADGKPYDLKYKNGFAVIAFVGTPPYPYANRSNLNSPKGQEIFFKREMTDEEMRAIYLEEVSVVKRKEGRKYVIAGGSGYVAHVAGVGNTVSEAREKMYGLISAMAIPKMFYRTDIGIGFMKRDGSKLRDWGWI